MATDDHGKCPHCGADMNGGLIWATLREQGGEDYADRVASDCYGATRTRGKWGRQIALYSIERDRTVAWRCPDCGGEWTRG